MSLSVEDLRDRNAVPGLDGQGECTLFGLPISTQSQEQLIEELLRDQPRGSGPQLLATVNLDHVVNLRKNPRFREAYGWAWRVTIDGAPVQAYARLRGVAPPARITGADLFVQLAHRWQPGRHRLFFCISSEEVGARMRAFLLARGFAEQDLSFETPPFGFEKDAAASTALAARIAQFAPTHLMFALGSPKSEIWVHEHRRALGDMKVLAIGAAVEFLVGMKARAPRWMRSAGLEWTWRLASEPRRLFRRYCVESFGFLLAVAEDWRERGRPRP